jgi:DNA-binding HxlR family transcriptional regulator
MVGRLNTVREVVGVGTGEVADRNGTLFARDPLRITSSAPASEETEFRRTHRNSERRFLRILFRDCPVEISLSVLGKKWALYTLRDIGVYNIDRFNRLLESHPGISPKVLATRLNQLEAAGMIRRIERQRSPMLVRWALTEKGYDTIPILMMFAAFESKYHPDVVFDDKKPRKMHEFLDQEGMALVRSFF